MSAEVGFTENMVAHTLERERYPTRFEDFCVQLMSDHDNLTYVRTSRSYDLGKDGRATNRYSGRVPPMICCGTEPNPVDKAVADAARISQNDSPKHLVFCFTDPHFSEDKAKKIETAVRGIFPELETVRSFGAVQLSQLAVLHPTAFEKYYAPELQDLRAALAVQSAKSEVELTGLRIALTTQLHNDAQTRRGDLVRNLILTALSSGKSLTIAALAKEISDKLRLPRIVQIGWLQNELAHLAITQMLDVSDRSYTITDAGRKELAARTDRGSSTLLSGRSTIQDLIRDLTGSESGEGEFNQVWNILKDGISVMFLSHGAQVVESIASILGGNTSARDWQDLRSHIENIGNRIRHIQGGGTRIEEVAQAIVDMFSERTSAAFEWLANICEAFLHLCILGLEPTSQEQINKHLKEIDLILDTDVAMSLVSEGEANHTSTKAVIVGWSSLGGGLYIPPPVLEEMAHHAWISRIDFERLSSSLDTMDEVEMGRLVLNVFVRGFVAESKRTGEKCTQRRWGQYIAAFKGSHDEDYDNILALLNDYGCKFLAEDRSDNTLARAIAEILFDERKAKLGSKAAAIRDLKEKSGRDGRLLAILAKYREVVKGQQRTCYIVSGGLRRGAKALYERTGEHEAVIYMAAVAWFLSLVPGVRLTANTLRTVLFDADIRLRVDPLERATLRFLHASEQYKMHLSRRGTLKQAVRAEIKRRAEEFQLDENDIERRIIEARESDIEMSSQIIAAAVDSIAMSQAEREIASLKAQNQELQRKLDRQRERKGRRNSK